MKANCGFCERLKELTFHHYIPKTLHTNKFFKKIYKTKYMREHGIYLCNDCHSAVHDFFNEKELGKNYNDKNKLLSHEKMINFLKWIKNKNSF
jgi:uncharacterized protein YlaI